MMRAPRFWDRDVDPKSREGAPLTRLLMTPLASVYATVTARRIAKADPVRLEIPVICIGNLTAGGTGKSPVVAALRDHLSARHDDLRIATLSRGYGGKLREPVKVDGSVHSAADVGDEALMHAAGGEAWIGADRAAAGQAMEADGVHLIIMDDGHQNPGLFKDLSFIVVDRAAGFGNGYVLPKGPLREPVQAGLERADAIIATGEGELPDAIEQSGLPVLSCTVAPTAPVAEMRYVAFAGIGRPEKFFDTLEAAGTKPADAIPFPDHHVYTDSDISYLRSLAQKNDAQLITTEKDFVRLRKDQREGIVTLPVRAVFDAPEMLDRLLASVAERLPR